MTEQASIHQALAAVMAELPAIGKDGRADPAQGGYAYRGIEQITRHAQGLFAKHGVVTVPQVRTIDVKDITVRDKPWTDTTLVVDYLLVGPDGSTMTATTVGIGRDNSDKGGNKAMTQAYKYLLLQLLCISDAKDDTDGQTHEADSRPEHPNAARVRRVLGELAALDEAGRDAFKEWKGARRVSEKALIDSEQWLVQVESWLDEQAAKQ